MVENNGNPIFHYYSGLGLNGKEKRGELTDAWTPLPKKANPPANPNQYYSM